MFPFVIWVVGMAVAVLLGLAVHLTPVLYHLCVFFEWHLMRIVESATGRSLSMGGIILASLVAWGVLGALVGGILLGSSSGLLPVWFMGGIAAAWGGSVGYQVGAQNLIHYYRRPGSIDHQHPGYLGRQDNGAQPDRAQRPLDEVLRDSVILGEAREQSDPNER